MTNLNDRVAIVTGASRGVGRSVALTLAKQGCDIVLAAKTVEPHPKLPGTILTVAKEVEELGRRALPVQTDVRFVDQIQAMVGKAADEFGRIDILINNAGAAWWHPIEETPEKRFDLVMGVNVRAAFLCSRAVIPHLRENGGHILMMSPPVNPNGSVGKAPYLCSKVGMTLLAQAIDTEEAEIAAHALWPVTGIKTAATENFGLGTDKDWRTPEILADATVALLARSPGDCSFRAWLDEEVLAEEGISDLTKYRCDPDSEPDPWSIQWVDPDWSR